MLKRISIAVLFLQLILLFSVQYYYAKPLSKSPLKAEQLKETQKPFSDFGNFPAMNDFVLDEKQGKEKNHSGHHEVQFLNKTYVHAVFYRSDDYGIHTQPTRNYELRYHLAIKVLLI